MRAPSHTWEETRDDLEDACRKAGLLECPAVGTTTNRVVIEQSSLRMLKQVTVKVYYTRKRGGRHVGASRCLNLRAETEVPYELLGIMNIYSRCTFS